MKKLRIAVLLVTVISLLGLILACDTGGSSGTTGSVPQNNTPKASDYNVSGTGNFIVAAGTSRTVTVTLKPDVDGSPGQVTVKYTDVDKVTTTTAPSDLGNYAVTFDVAAATGWNAIEGLSAGFVSIGRPDFTFPEREDFNVVGFPATMVVNGTRPTISITPKATKSQGTITIIYKNNATGAETVGTANGGGLPTAVGLYNASFNVAEDAANRYSAVNGLNAGTLLISPEGTPSVQLLETKWGDFNVTVGGKTFGTDNNSAAAVDVVYSMAPLPIVVTPTATDATAYPVNRPGLVSYVYYDIGDTSEVRLPVPPTNKGNYRVKVTLDYAIDENYAWTSIEFNLWYNITVRAPVRADYDITRTDQAEAGKLLNGTNNPVRHVAFAAIVDQKNSSGTPISWKPLSAGKLTIYYEGVSDDGTDTWDNTKGGFTESDVSTWNSDPISANAAKAPPQKAGTYKIFFEVAAPVSGSLTSIDHHDTAIANWTGTSEKLAAGTLVLAPLKPITPAFVNVWVDADEGVLKLSTPNNDNLIVPGGSITISVSGPGAVFEWRVDGNKVVDAAGATVTERSYTFSANAEGNHNISLVVTNAGKIYNQNFTIRVQKPQQ